MDAIISVIDNGEKKVEATHNPAMSEEQLKDKYVHYEELKTFREECRIDFTREEDADNIQYLATVDDVGILPRGNIITIQAAPKNGKTNLTYIFAAVVLGCNFGRVKPTARGSLNVVIFDTEQNKASVKEGGKKVLRMCGKDTNNNDPHFNIFAIKNVSNILRLELIRMVIDAAEVKPDLLVIDGAADLTQDFNNNTESQSCAEGLAQMAEKTNCVIIVCQHENRDKTNPQLKGHLGQILSQKSSDVIKVEKSRNEAMPIFNVRHEMNRNEYFMPFAFKLDADAVPIPADVEQKPGEPEDEFSRLNKRMEKAFESKQQMSYGELVKEYTAKNGVKESMAKKDIANAIKEENGILIKHGNLYMLNKRH